MTKTSHQHCEAGTPEGAIHCEDHSGVMMWMKINAGIISVASTAIIALFSYSAFVQVPTLREAVAKEVARINLENQRVTDKLADHERRISLLEVRSK